jgi:FixJ family two-component response regulator
LPDNPVVFVVDDAPVVLNSIAMLLELVGFDVKTFSSAEDFLASYEPSQVGCLLLDVRLPGISGVELQRKLKSDASELPIILMSGHASHEVRDEGTANGAIGFLEKPVDSRQLIDLVRNAIGNV